MISRLAILLLFLTGIVQTMIAQESLQAPRAVDTISFLSKLNARVSHLDAKLEKHAGKMLGKQKKQDRRIMRKLAKHDSAAAANFRNIAGQQYAKLEHRLAKVTALQQYEPELDTLKLSLEFLASGKILPSAANGYGRKFDEALSAVKGLEAQFQQAEEIKDFWKERKQQFLQHLQSHRFSREIKKLSKRAYYFQAQLSGYKETLKDKTRIEKKVLELLASTKVFKDFIAKNSFLSRLFPVPSNPILSSASTPQQGFAALQTRTQVSSFVQQAGWSSTTAMSQLQQNIQNAQSELSELRNKLTELGAGGDILEIPGFKINQQKTKSFFKRFEIGTNLQSQRSKMFFPATSDLGLSLGYKLNDKSVVGIGASYKLGLGSSWQHIRMSHQGIGLRTYIDWKIKGSFWISGGYEKNYRAQFKKIDELRDHHRWQSSGLVGLTKIVSLKTKFFKKTKLQLLWDFLSYQQAPATEPLLFRIGYNF